MAMPAADLTPLHCGDRVSFSAILREPHAYRDPGVWQYPEYLKGEGIGLQASLKDNLVHIDASPQHLSFQCRVEALHRWASSRLPAFVISGQNSRLPHFFQLDTTDAGTLNAMLFGDRTHLSRDLRLHFERTGTFHLFVVAGIHVALVAGALLALTTWLGAGRILSTLITLSGTTAFALFTGFGAPVQRSLAMTILFLLTRLLSRRSSDLNSIGAAVLGILALSPRSLFEASFQMTLLAVVSIIGVAVPLGEHSFLPYARAARHIHLIRIDPQLPPRLAQFRVTLRLLSEHLRPLLGRRISGWLPSALTRITLWTAELVLASVICEIAMALPMAVYFHRITALALPANLLCMPFIGAVMVSAVIAFLGAIILGAGFGVYLSVDFALLTEVLPSARDRAKDLGVINIANSLPQVIAPAIAAPVVKYVGGYGVLYGLAATVTLLGAVLVRQIRSVT